MIEFRENKGGRGEHHDALPSRITYPPLSSCIYYDRGRTRTAVRYHKIDFKTTTERKSCRVEAVIQPHHIQYTSILNHEVGITRCR